MPSLSIYLTDDQIETVKERIPNLSRFCQLAIEEELEKVGDGSAKERVRGTAVQLRMIAERLEGIAGQR